MYHSSNCFVYALNLKHEYTFHKETIWLFRTLNGFRIVCRFTPPYREVAAAAGLSRRMRYYTFRETLRRTPAEHLLRERMTLAKKLLAETDQSIGEIAHATGLFPSRNINRCFWRVENMSPRAWRRAHRKNP